MGPKVWQAKVRLVQASPLAQARLGNRKPVLGACRRRSNRRCVAPGCRHRLAVRRGADCLAVRRAAGFRILRKDNPQRHRQISVVACPHLRLLADRKRLYQACRNHETCRSSRNRRHKRNRKRCARTTRHRGRQVFKRVARSPTAAPNHLVCSAPMRRRWLSAVWAQLGTAKGNKTVGTQERPNMRPDTRGQLVIPVQLVLQHTEGSKAMEGSKARTAATQAAPQTRDRRALR